MADYEPHEIDGFKARWIRVSADMLEHDAFAGEPYSKHAAWLWLIANAAWKPRRFKAPNVNAMVELERGQVLAARHFLADKWQWSEKKVRNFLAFLLSQNMIEMGQSKGRFANIVTICNYDKYQSADKEKGQLNGQMRAGCGPVEGQTLTKNTNTTNSTIPFSSIERPKEKTTSGRDFWANAINASPNPETESHVGATLENGKIKLHNGTRKIWLERFENDEARLGLALEQAAGYVQPNSGRPLEAQVSSQLAKQLADKTDRDKRYAAAAKAKGQSGSGTQSSTERSMSRQRALLDMLDAKIASEATQ